MTQHEGHDIWAVKVGPVMVGGVEKRKPETLSDLRWNIAAWVVAIVLIGSASPLAGIVGIIMAAIWLAAKTAPAADEGKSHDRTD